MRRIWPTACSMKSGAPSSTTSTAFLPAQKPAISSGTSGCTTLSTSVGTADVAVDVAEARERQPAVQHVEQAALHDDADVAVGGPEPLVELVVDDELARRRQPPLDLVGLLAEGRGRMAQPVVVEAGRARGDAWPSARPPRCPWRGSCRTCGRRGCAAPG